MALNLSQKDKVKLAKFAMENPEFKTRIAKALKAQEEAADEGSVKSVINKAEIALKFKTLGESIRDKKDTPENLSFQALQLSAELMRGARMRSEATKVVNLINVLKK